MSSKTKVRKDSHGVFVRTGGYLFRPQPGKYSGFHDPMNLLRKHPSKYKEGDAVKAHHIPETSLAQVGHERWFSHGEYFAGGKKSDELWEPFEGNESRKEGNKDQAESNYVLQPTEGSYCPKCGQRTHLLCDKKFSERKSAFYICFGCKFVGQVGVGPVTAL